MINFIIISLVVLVVAFIILVLYSCCVVSGKCAIEEENYELSRMARNENP